MSSKAGLGRPDRKNMLLETYYKEYLEAPKLDLANLTLETLESFLYGVAHAHDLVGRQVQDLGNSRSGVEL